MNISSFMPTKVISGKNCVKDYAQFLTSSGKRYLIVTGKNSAKLSGALDDITSILMSNKIEFTIFDEIEENPQTLTCHKGGKKARETDTDYIIAIGGGSVLDAAKAIAIFAKNPDLSHTDIYNRNVPSAKLPVILVGLSSGTGSEVTGVSVLTNSDTGLKKSISGADCYAEISYCDYAYTKSMPVNVRISTCLDAFCHAVEAYVASSCNSLVEIYSLKAISIIGKHIMSPHFSDLTESDFDDLYNASLFAGLAINIAGTCFPHTVGYYFTECHAIPHGRACACLMPVLLDKAKENCPEKLEAILKTINCDIDELKNKVYSLADVNIQISAKEAEEISLRWKDGVKNFDRSPGGFNHIEAQKALMTVSC